MTQERGAAGRAVLPAACLALSLLILAPTLRPGFVLVYDMVFTPRQPLLAESLGLGSAMPRAVPVDAVVALLTGVVPGDVLQKAVLVLTLWAAAYGAARLVPSPSTAVRLVAATGYAWNAYVAERLFLGHWAVLVGYAALPWVVSAGLRLRRGEPRAWVALVLAMAPAVLTPTGGLLAAGAGVAAAGRRRLPVTIGLAALLNAPWWVPGVLRGGGAVSDPSAVTAFAARAEGPGGPLVSVLSLGGIWNAEVVPASRQGLLVALVAAALVAGTAYGLRPLVAAWGRSAVTALGLLAGAGLLVAAATAVPGADAALRWLVAEVPGAGLLRDAHKWAAWWALLTAPAFALAAHRLAGRLTEAPGRAGRAVVLATAALLPLVVLPDLAWGGFGRLAPVRYPADWYAVRDLLAADRRPGEVLVLPFQPYRRFEWNAYRTQLDPAPRFLPRGALVDDTLTVDGHAVRGEDPLAARARDALDDPAALARLGVGWILVEHATPGDTRVPAGLVPVHVGQWLTLHRIPGPVSAAADSGPQPGPVLLADAVAAVFVIGALLLRVLPAGTFITIGGRRRLGRLRRGGDRADAGRIRARDNNGGFPRPSGGQPDPGEQCAGPQGGRDDQEDPSSSDRRT